MNTTQEFSNSRYYKLLHNAKIVDTNIINTKKFIPNKDLSLKTTILDTILVNMDNVNTEIVNTKIIKHNKSSAIIKLSENSDLEIDSYVDKKKRNIYLKQKINSGSYNNIYSISLKKNDVSDRKIIIRISNINSNSDSIKLELKGIKIQHKLALKCINIGRIVDYGKLHYGENEYSIIEKYGISMRDVLQSQPRYKNISTILKFMKDFLLTLQCIHNNNYAHLDLKPSNILLKNTSIDKNMGIITDLDFALVDFGAAQIFRNNNSKNLSAQMASAAFSPPELLQYRFGKKSDVWAYGVICYLVCVRCFFFQAGASKIFMGKNTNQIIQNVTNSLQKLKKNMTPEYLTSQKKITYFGNLENNFELLIDFFSIIFVDEKKRPTVNQLLKHELFNM